MQENLKMHRCLKWERGMVLIHQNTRSASVQRSFFCYLSFTLFCLSTLAQRITSNDDMAYFGTWLLILKHKSWWGNMPNYSTKEAATVQKSLLNYSRILKHELSLKVLKKSKVVWLFKLFIKHTIFCTDLLFSLETVTEMWPTEAI